MEKCDIEEVSYIHTTDPKNLPSIEKHGLLVSKCRLDYIKDLYEERTSSEKAEKVCKPMVFAIDLDHGKEEWETGGDWMDVIGIKSTKWGECAALFQYGGINNPFEFISYKNISPHCLCLVDEPNDFFKQHKRMKRFVWY